MSSNGTSQEDGAFPSVVELNVGGVFYTTSLSTLTKDPSSLLGQMFSGKSPGGRNIVMRDSKGKYFIDRDGVLFRYILDFLRNQKLILPENFHERERLKQEAEYFNLPEMVESIANAPSPTSNALATRSGIPEAVAGQISGYICIGYRGSFAFGRDGLADVKFRKLTRILVNGKVAICREVFGDSLNESRDPDRCSEDRYTSRFFLKHTFLEQAFDNLQEAGFRCVASCGSGTSCGGANEPLKPGVDSEENRWNHYNEFIFVRP